MLKRRSRKTQRQLDLLEEQTGMRYLEHLAISSSINNSINTGFQHIDDVAGRDSNTSPRFSGYSYVYVSRRERIQCTLPNKDKSYEAKWCDVELQNEITELVRKEIYVRFPFEQRTEIEFMTMFKNEGVIYRADPCYKTTAWQDWAFCDWGDGYGLVPVHLLIFIDLTKLVGCFNLKGVVVMGGGVCAIVHMVKESLDNTFVDNEGYTCDYRAHDKSQLFYKASKMIDDDTERPQLAIVSFNSIAGPCVAVKHDLGDPSDQNYIFMKSRSEWSELMPNLMKDGITLKRVI
jgi:hypothetical protein